MTMPSVAIIVVNYEQADLINGSGALNENSRAFTYEDNLGGEHFDVVLVLDRPIYREERNWLESLIQHCAKPDASISYAST